jgi:dihydrofolate reductase
VKLAIIAAVAANRAIGKDGRLPWHYSDDLKRFRRLTMGHAVLMGRKTYESIGTPLSGRRNVVVSSRPIPGVETYRSVDEALQALRDTERVFVIGGGAMYAALLERADELYLTRVNRIVEADAFFPVYEHLLGGVFVLTRREDHGEYIFEDYVRQSPIHV